MSTVDEVGFVWCNGCMDAHSKNSTCPGLPEHSPFLSGSQVISTPSPTAQSLPHPIGGGATRATTLPTDGEGRKQFPVATGFMDYFPDAIAAVAHLSWKGNEQHNPGQPLHWARHKSTDEADTLMRHFLQRGTMDSDGIRHSVKVAWRALAMLQREIEVEALNRDIDELSF